MDKTIYWPYNETFGFFHHAPLAGKRARRFVDDRNQCKGGHWILKTAEEYNARHRDAAVASEVTMLFLATGYLAEGTPTRVQPVQLPQPVHSDSGGAEVHL